MSTDVCSEIASVNSPSMTQTPFLNAGLLRGLYRSEISLIIVIRLYHRVLVDATEFFCQYQYDTITASAAAGARKIFPVLAKRRTLSDRIGGTFSCGLPYPLSTLMVGGSTFITRGKSFS
jgi:hypothetical protein